MGRQPNNRQDDSVRKINELIQELGKIPPQALEIEEAVIGACILESDAYLSVSWLKGHHFYKDSHRIIWEHIEKFAGSGLDILTLSQSLGKSEQLDTIGGPYFLTQLSNIVSTASHIEQHATVILSKFKSRECIRFSSMIQTAGFEDDPDAVGHIIMQLIDALAEDDISGPRLNKELKKEVLENIKSVTMGSNEISGLSTGLFVLDRLIYGLNAPDLIILAGRPGMGKTALALAIALFLGFNDIPSLFFSLEMSAIQLYMRELTFKSGIPMGKFKVSNGLDDKNLDLLDKTAEELDDIPLFIDDTPSLHVNEMRARARRMKIKYDIKAIFVDYIQLAQGTTPGSGNNREQEISYISRTLKAIAKELNVPVIALSQLSRAVENRSDKKPNLADLRESGAIEQDADIVIFPWRAEYYDFEHIQGPSGLVSSEGKVILKVAKHRNGSIGDLLIDFEAKLMKFKNPEEEEFSATEKDQQKDLFSESEEEDEKPF